MLIKYFTCKWKIKAHIQFSIYSVFKIKYFILYYLQYNKNIFHYFNDFANNLSNTVEKKKE